MQRSLDRLFQRLGSERPYEIGAQFTGHLVCQSRGTRGTRDRLIAWLRWNDPDGYDADRGLSLENRSTLTLDEARALLRIQIEFGQSL